MLKLLWNLYDYFIKNQSLKWFIWHASVKLTLSTMIFTKFLIFLLYNSSIKLCLIIWLKSKWKSFGHEICYMCYLGYLKKFLHVLHFTCLLAKTALENQSKKPQNFSWWLFIEHPLLQTWINYLMIDFKNRSRTDQIKTFYSGKWISSELFFLLFSTTLLFAAG